MKRIAFDLGGIVFDLDAWGVEGLSKIALQILFERVQSGTHILDVGLQKKDVTKIERNLLIQWMRFLSSVLFDIIVFEAWCLHWIPYQWPVWHLENTGVMIGDLDSGQKL